MIVKQNVAIFDIDRTIAYDPKKPKYDFHFTDEYALSLVPKKLTINRLENYMTDKWVIILLTGRPERRNLITLSWLYRYDIKYNKLIMRPNDIDSSKISIYKGLEVLKISSNAKEIHVYDDEPDDLIGIGKMCISAKLFRVREDKIESFDFWERPLPEKE